MRKESPIIRTAVGTMTCLAAFLMHLNAQGQDALSVLPTPTGLNDEVTLTIDVSKSEENALKAILEANPELPVYIWTWSPSDPVGGNGSWDNSSESMLLTKQSDLVYTLTFTPTQFYSNVASLYSNGISCLAKLKNGGTFAGFEDLGEAKTEDFNIPILPKLCEEEMCIFPEGRRSDDYISVTYNSNLDEDLQFTEGEDIYLQIRGRASSGDFYTLAEDADIANVPELKMTPVENKDGFYRLIFLPDQLFEGIIPSEFDIISMVCYPTVPGFTYEPDTTPWDGIYFETGISLLDCE